MKINKIKINRILSFSLILISSFFVGSIANAGLNDAVSGIVGHLVQFLVWIMGGILFVLIYILIWVAQYNDFINSKAVENGWTIVRDLCNMFFILILLIIAFATILRMESYNWKKMLPKLLIMAVLINFSKTICGIFIDFSQIIMLTFVNGFKNMGSANLTQLLGIKDILAIDADNAKDVTALSVAGSYLLALIYTIIAVIVVLVMVVVLVMRMIMLWVYIVLSPLAYLLSAFPQGQKYASQWWGEFSKLLITGPVLAFFIWLSFVSISSQTGTQILGSYNNSNIDISKTDTSGKKDAPIAGIAKAGTPDNMIKFIISIGMLIGGLMITQQIGGAAGGIAGKGMAAIQKGKGLAWSGSKTGVKVIGGFGVDKLSQKVGADLNIFRVYKRVQQQREENKNIRASGIYNDALKNAAQAKRLAFLSTGNVAWQNISSWKNFKATTKRFVDPKVVSRYHEEAKKAEEERKTYWTSEDKYQSEGMLGVLRGREKSIVGKIGNYKKMRNNLSEEDKKQLNELEKQREDVRTQIKSREENLRTKTVDNNKVKELDEIIVKNKYLDELYEVKEVSSAQAAADAELESNGNKKVGHIKDSNQLSRILKEAIADGNQGLIMAVSKRMTKLGDYNEMMKMMGLGTGTKGMHELARRFEEEGKMTRDSSLALIAEIGGIAKDVNHFGAFGAAYMKDGRWMEATEDEAQEAQLAEMLKMQPQEFARKVNRLGLGYYDSGEEHSLNTWKMSKAALAYTKLNQSSLSKQYADTGMQNALEHLASTIDKLAENNISEELLKVIKNRATGKGANVSETIKNIKT